MDEILGKDQVMCNKKNKKSYHEEDYVELDKPVLIESLQVDSNWAPLGYILYFQGEIWKILIWIFPFTWAVIKAWQRKRGK